MLTRITALLVAALAASGATITVSVSDYVGVSDHGPVNNEHLTFSDTNYTNRFQYRFPSDSLNIGDQWFWQPERANIRDTISALYISSHLFSATLSDPLSINGIGVAALVAFPNDFVSALDANTVRKITFPASTDPLSLADALAARKFGLAAVSESFSIAPSVAELGAHRGSLADNFSLSPSVVESALAVRPQADSIAALDVAAVLGIKPRVLTESLSAGDSLAAPKFAFATTTGAVSVSDALSRTPTRNSSVSELLSASSALALSALHPETASDSLSASDASASLGAHRGAIADTVAASVVVAGQSLHLGSAVESVALLDSDIGNKFGLTAISESLSLTSAIGPNGVYGRSSSDSASLADGAIRLPSFRPGLSTDPVSMPDAVSSVRGVIVGTSGAATVTDSASGLGLHSAALSSAATVTDAISSDTPLRNARPAESGIITDFVIKTAMLGSSSPIGLADSPGVSLKRIAGLSASVSSADAPAVTRIVSVSVADSAIGADAPARSPVRQALTSESVQLSDSLAPILHPFRARITIIAN